ncbi:MAG TPA: YhfC family glutamic-type intramembrane protease [Anaerolineales bacterium]|nr:YhfC family glutamic-type intramembrane protease [Anaerolineales bacterium]
MAVFVRLLNPLLMILLGLGAGVAVARLLRDPWRLYGIGAWTFILSQVLHIPFNAWVLQPLLEDLVPRGPVLGTGLLIYALALGLSAGVFEEPARWLAFRMALRSRRWHDALALGAGHGGIEAVLVGVLALYTVIQLLAVQGPGAAEQLSPAQLEALGGAESQIAAFWAAPWYGVLLGALERLFAICFHLSASVLVLQAFRRGNLLWVALAVLWHAVFNAAAVYTAAAWGPYWAEAVLGAGALIALGIVYALREPPADASPPAAPAQPLAFDRRGPSAEEIEGSRYGEVSRETLFINGSVSFSGKSLISKAHP